MRTIPVDRAVTTAACNYWREEGYSDVAVLFVSDAYGEGFQKLVVEACSRTGTNIVSFAYSTTDTFSFEAQMQRVANANLNVFLAVTLGISEASFILQKASEFGILGAGTSWMFADGIFGESLIAIDPELHADAHGSLYISQKLTSEEDAAWSRFTADWPSFDTAHVNIHLPDAWKLPPNFFKEDLQQSAMDIAALEYDAVAAAAIHACEVAPRGPLGRDFGERFIATKTNISFDGLTGKVGFDANGDRLNARVQLKNVLYGTDGFETPFLGVYRGGVWSWVRGGLAASGIVYNGGELVAPSATDPPTDDGGGDVNVITIVASCVALLCLASVAATVVIYLEWRRKKRKRLKLLCLERTLAPPLLTLAHDHAYHVFLSHKWPTGQAQVAVIRSMLMMMMPSVRVFLDVYDLKDVGSLEQYVSESALVLVFLSRGYFNSTNCLRESRDAVLKKKPLVLVHEHDSSRGGAPLAKFKSDCPEDLKPVFFDKERPICPWFTKPEYQLMSMVMISEALLLASPKYSSCEDLKCYLPYAATTVRDAKLGSTQACACYLAYLLMALVQARPHCLPRCWTRASVGTRAL
mmetsp:Transcript_51323/g.111619  ORF Transcript_51323/g.111619 Transcript_51323/m.111619 type:complete len:581 (-) Transcript_51323:1512-3254(-)